MFIEEGRNISTAWQEPQMANACIGHAEVSLTEKLRGILLQVEIYVETVKGSLDWLPHTNKSVARNHPPEFTEAWVASPDVHTRRTTSHLVSARVNWEIAHGKSGERRPSRILLSNQSKMCFSVVKAPIDVHFARATTSAWRDCRWHSAIGKTGSSKRLQTRQPSQKSWNKPPVRELRSVKVGTIPDSTYCHK